MFARWKWHAQTEISVAFFIVCAHFPYCSCCLLCYSNDLFGIRVCVFLCDMREHVLHTNPSIKLSRYVRQEEDESLCFRSLCDCICVCVWVSVLLCVNKVYYRFVCVPFDIEEWECVMCMLSHSKSMLFMFLFLFVCVFFLLEENLLVLRTSYCVSNKMK